MFCSSATQTETRQLPHIIAADPAYLSKPIEPGDHPIQDWKFYLNQPGGRSQTCFEVFYASYKFHWIPLDSMEKPTWKGCSCFVTSRREVVVTYISCVDCMSIVAHVCHVFRQFSPFQCGFPQKKKGSQLKKIEKHGTNGPNMWKTWVFRCLTGEWFTKIFLIQAAACMNVSKSPNRVVENLSGNLIT